MSPAGRTSWWPKDAAWLRRELIVELGEEHGPGGATVLDALSGWAQEQRAHGEVRGGFRTLAREAFVTIDQARAIVQHAAQIGALDDLTVAEDGRRFDCRVSGWQADSERGRAAFRKAGQRADEVAELNGTDRDMSQNPAQDCDMSRPVTASPLPDQNKQEQKTENGHVEPARLDHAAATRDLFAYWQERCDHTQAKLTADRKTKIAARLREGYSPDQIRLAIDGAARAAYVNDAGKRFDDIELICRTGSKLEDFITRATATNVDAAVMAGQTEAAKWAARAEEWREEAGA